MTNLLSRLREATSSLHKDTERLIFPEGMNINRDRYVFFLKCNTGFHMALEPSLFKTSFSKNRFWNSFDRKKLTKLKSDLEGLGEDYIEDPLEGYFENWSECQLLGAAYVSEGSTLGGQVILKNLTKKSFFDLNHFGRFLIGNGKESGNAWKSFLKLLEEEGEKAPEEVIDGAIRSFKAFKYVAISQRKNVVDL